MQRTRTCCADAPGYYWRDYTGAIPNDAVLGNWTMDNTEQTFIGRVFYKPSGVFPATIIPNQPEVYFPMSGVKRADDFVEILCSKNTQSFGWIAVDKADFQLQTINQHLVKGGQEQGRLLHIGRISYEGDVVIGKVLSANLGNAKMWFAHKDKELSSDKYEVLVYYGPLL